MEFENGFDDEVGGRVKESILMYINRKKKAEDI
jgi:hypothetical protein